MDIRRLYWLLGLLIVVALPVMFITTNVRVAFNSQLLYTYAIDGFNVPSVTGLSREELLKGTQGLIDYFNSDDDLITVTVDNRGITEPLFTEREAIHFRDVRTLLRGIYMVQTVATLLVLASVVTMAGAVVRDRRDVAVLILRRLKLSVIVSIIAIVAIGIFAALGGFDFLFLQFHLISFSNDLWQGTAADRMIQMFPQAFFLQATLLIGLATAIEMTLVFLAATLSLRSLRRS